MGTLMENHLDQMMEIVKLMVEQNHTMKVYHWDCCWAIETRKVPEMGSVKVKWWANGWVPKTLLELHWE